MIYIKNIRYGLATNSSSSHSIVILNDPAYNYTAGQDFGWDFFTASSPESKTAYIGHCLANQYSSLYKLPLEDALILAAAHLEVELDDEGYVDHQSVLTFPMDYDAQPYNKVVHKEFLKEFAKHLSNPNIAILGGNDNTEEEHHLLEGSYTPSWLFKAGENSYIKYDEKYNYWTSFNRNKKVRFSFEDKEILKGSTPDLVDLKITDYCTYNCDYCYQDSTVDGTHADANEVKKTLSTLKRNGVFEVAIGGGEPTQHPDFLNILISGSKAGITMNFTTKNYKWVAKNYSEIKDIVGAIGISVDNAEEVNKVGSALKQINHTNSQWDSRLNITLHHPIGISSRETIVKIIESAAEYNLDILFLGFKMVGRGEQFRLKTPEQNIDLIEVIKEQKEKHGYDMPRIGFDTLLVQQYKGSLKEISEPVYWTLEEGAFSMYIDLVENKAAKSSYEDSKDYVRFNNCDVISIYESFQK